MIGNCDIRSDKSYRAPLELEDKEHVADEDASSLVSFEEQVPFEIVESSLIEEDPDDDDDGAVLIL